MNKRDFFAIAKQICVLEVTSLDYEIFQLQLRKAYKLSNCSFSFEDAQSILMTYFAYFESFMGYRHKPLKTKTLVDILNNLDGDGQFDAECYPILIEQYFCTEFENCDRCISHFMAGDIRSLRYYETLY